MKRRNYSACFRYSTMDSPFPYRLTNARKMKGLSLQKLAHMLGSPFNKQLLHRLENGSQTPNSDQLIRLSNALDQPLDYFLKLPAAGLGKIDSLKTHKVGKKASNRILETASDYFERYLELEDLLGIENQALFPLQKVKLSQDDYAAIAQAASNIREKIWNVGSGPLHNVSGVLETNGIKVFITAQSGEYLTDADFGGFSAVMNDNIGCIVANGNPNVPPVELRFSLLREFTNLYLDLSGLGHKESKSICDKLAGAILISKTSLVEAFGEYRTLIHISELKLFKYTFGAPIPVILSVLRQNGIISQSHFTEQMVEYNSRHKAHDLGGFEGIERPYRFKQLLIRALVCGVISESKAASLMNMKVAAFREYLDKMFDEDSGY